MKGVNINKYILSNHNDKGSVVSDSVKRLCLYSRKN